MLLATHRLNDLAESPEHRSLARERYDVPLEERDDLLKEHLSRRDAKHQHLGIPRLRRDRAVPEDLSGELQKRPAALMLVQKELWTSDEAESARMLLDAHRERSFALDESRKEPLGTLVARESFLLIVRTRHVVTTVNVRSDINGE